VKTVEGLRDYIGADSLAYLSYEGMVAAVEGGDEPGNQQKHCTGCFNGVYPIEHDP
jgi:amidophosphoribosyltransferase